MFICRFHTSNFAAVMAVVCKMYPRTFLCYVFQNKPMLTNMRYISMQAHDDD